MQETIHLFIEDNFMLKKHSGVHIGLRTIKTAAAVILSMIIVNPLGTTSSKLIFAMLGAMAAVMPTFKESLESCLAQIVGVFFGALAGVLLLALKLPPLVATGIGIILVITLYNALRIRYAPGIPCFIVVMLCTTPDIQPMSYAIGRIWDTAIGLGIGLLINMLVFPYDNSRQIRATVESLDTALISFLEELFDGDSIFPATEDMTRKIDDMARQLNIFSNQKLLLRMKRQKKELETFRLCESKARALVSQMEVLSQMGQPGRLSEANRELLISCDANIRDQRVLEDATELDIVTNYHVSQILALRKDLLDALRKE